MKRETWRPVPGFPGYEVSNRGRVRSWKQKRNGKLPYIMRQQVNCEGFHSLTILHDRRPHYRLVHRLVLLAFKGPPPTPRHQGNHLDRDRSNNAITNLRWATPSENQRHRWRHGGQSAVTKARISATWRRRMAREQTDREVMA